MRILIPTVDYPPIEGGISTVTLQVSRELAALGHEVTVVAPYFPEMDAFDASEPVRVVRYGGYDYGWFRFFPLLRAVWPFRGQADILLAINVSYGGVIGRWMRGRYGVPYIVFAYAYEFLKFAHTPLVAAGLRQIYRHALATVAISRFTQRNLAKFGVSPDRIRCILPGAPEIQKPDEEIIRRVRSDYDLEEDTPVILAVGRFIPRKGQLTLIQALPTVLETNPQTRLILAGRGPCREKCQEKARALGVEAHVHFPGYVDDACLAALYSLCTVFALPTGEDNHGQVEGFGLVFCEAHAYGKPVVAGRSGGVPDAVLHEKTGLLVPPDDPVALAAALCRILNDPPFARQLGEAGRYRVETELNWRVFTERVMSLLREDINE